MKIFKKTITGILFLLGIILVLAAIAPKEINANKTIIINASQTDVFNAVNELKTWKHWSPWAKKDSTIKITCSDPSVGKGAYYTWTSDSQGAGSMTISETFNKDSLYTKVEFDGQGAPSQAKFFFRPTEEGTATTWSFHGKIPYPFNFMLLFQDIDGMLAEDYSSGLALLKTYVETNKTPEYKISKIDFPATRYLVQKATVRMADMKEHFEVTMPDVAMAFLDNKVKMAGPPAGLFYTWDEATQTSDLAIGIPTGADQLIDGLDVIDLAAGQALKINYYGPFEGTGAAHEAMAAFLESRNIDQRSTLAIERYITDPAIEPNPDKWLTEVIYLIIK